MSSNQRNRLALCMCVRNEAASISDHLSYHHYLGVNRAYVFLDHCTDNTKTILGAFPWVKTIDFSHPENCQGLPEHQNNCARMALKLARKEGFEWLMHIDPDEFVWANNPVESLIDQGNLLDLLDRVNSRTDLIHLRPKEVLPMHIIAGKKFWFQCYFQERNQIFKRDLLDPITDQIRQLDKWAGHCIGKSIVRISADVEPLDAHTWIRCGFEQDVINQKLNTENLGFLYHFVFAGPEQWLEKYRKLAWEPDTWLTGQKVPFPKQAWKEASLVLTEVTAKQYYDRWIEIDAQVLKQKVADGDAVRETHVRDIMLQLGSGTGIKWDC